MPDQNQKAPDAPPLAELVITLNAAGQVNVNGPIEQKMLCYGLIECARDAIKDFCASQERRVQPAPDGAMQSLNAAMKRTFGGPKS